MDYKAMKINAAKEAIKYIKDGMTLGLGTGTTTTEFIKILANEIKERELHIRCVPTSKGTEIMARNLGINIVYPDDVETIDLAVDGADQVSGNAALKGGGGALVREKIVDYAAKTFIIIVDSTKMVNRFTKPVVIEVLPFAYRFVDMQLRKICKESRIRLLNNGNVFISDNGNYIIDCTMDLDDPKKMEHLLNNIPGIVENGIFTKFSKVIVGYKDKTKEIDMME